MAAGNQAADLVSSNQTAIYRVLVEGLSPTERTVLKGMVHLAERHGTVFQIDGTPENSDIFILDGASRSNLELGRSRSDMAHRTIWIDPPATLQSAIQIKRPLRWSHLLELMERLVDSDTAPSVSTKSLTAVALTVDQYCGISLDVLRTHIGIAAQFVVDDARVQVRENLGSDRHMPAHIFLHILANQLPTNADAAGILRQITFAINQYVPQ